MRGAKRNCVDSCVASFELSCQAEGDLIEVYFYSLHAFGGKRADAYVADLKKTCTLLAEVPQMGRASKKLPNAIRRHEHEAHVIFYRELQPGRILIVRIFGRQQVPELHLDQ